MIQLDMFEGQTDLEKPVKNQRATRELHTQYLMRVQKFWATIQEDHREATRIKFELEDIARKLHRLGKYDIFNLKYKRVVLDEHARETKHGMQHIIYAENEREAIEFLDMDLAIHQSTGAKGCSIRYTRPKFIQVPDHLRKGKS